MQLQAGRLAAGAPVHSNLRSSPLERFVSQGSLQSACRTVAPRGRSSRSAGRLEIRREPAAAAVRCHANSPPAPTTLDRPTRALRCGRNDACRRSAVGAAAKGVAFFSRRAPSFGTAPNGRGAHGQGCCPTSPPRGKPELLWGTSAARVQL